jgi:hypothetical protein
VGRRRFRSLPDKLLAGVVGLSIALLVVSLLLALENGDADASEPSGVFGQVSTSACNGAVRVGDPPCPPYYGEIRILRRDESLIGTAHTDRAGRYRVALPPGRYIIDSNDGGKSIANRDGFVTVREGEFVRADVNHYSGVLCAFGQTWMHFASAPHGERPS